MWVKNASVSRKEKRSISSDISFIFYFSDKLNLISY